MYLRVIEFSSWQTSYEKISKRTQSKILAKHLQLWSLHYAHNRTHAWSRTVFIYTWMHICGNVVHLSASYWSSHVQSHCPVRSLVLCSAYSALRARKRPSGEPTTHSMAWCRPFSPQAWTEPYLFLQLWKRERSGKFLPFRGVYVKKKKKNDM